MIFRNTKLKKGIKFEAYPVSPEVIDIRSLKPFDLYMIENSVKKTHCALILEEFMRTEH